MPFNTDLAEKALNDKPRGFNAAAAEAALSTPSSRGFNTQAAEAALATPAPAPTPAPPPAAQPHGKNPFQQVGDAVGRWMHQQAQESEQARKRAAAIQDPFAPEKALLRPAAAPAGKVLHELQKTGDTSEALLAGRPGMVGPALTRGLTDKERDDDFSHVLGGIPAASVNKLPAGWPQTVGRTIVHGALDPLSYVGGLGFGEKAYKALAQHTLPAVLKGADKAGQAYVKGARHLGNALSEKEITREPYNAYRYQTTNGGIEHSPTRGGTFLTSGTPSESDIYAASGKKHLAQTVFDPKNPLHTPNNVDEAFHMLIGPDRAKVFQESARRDPQKYLSRIGKATGTKPAGMSSAQDALTGAIAKKYGFDSIVSNGPEKAIFALDPSAMRAPRESVRSLLGDTWAGNAQHTVDTVGHIASGAYKAAVPGGALKLGAARDFREKGDTIANRMFSAKNAGRAQMNAMQSAFSRELHDALKDVTPEEETQLYDALHFGRESELPEHLKPAAKRMSDLTDSLAHLSGDRELKAHLASNGFQIPEYAKPFDNGTRSLMRKSQYRKNYVPTRYDAQLSEFDASPEELSFLNGGMDNEGKGVTDALTLRAEKKAPQASVDRTDSYDPNLERRQGEGVLAKTPEEQRAIFEQRLHSAARAIAGRDTGRRAASLFNSAKPSYKLNLGPGNVKDVAAKAGSFAGLPPYVRDFFTDKFTPEADKQWYQKLAGAAPAINNANKSAMFISPVRHIMNIATLGTLAYPSVGGALQTAKTFAKIVGSSPEKRYKELKDAIDAGAVGVPSADRVTSETAKGGISKVLSDMTMKTPIVSHAINGVRKVYTMSGDILWSFDDASKATRFRRLLAKGEHPADAAAQTNAELIDYTNKSDFTNLLSYLAPFATYRSKLPGAIARNVVQHPERALTVNRAAPALAGGYQQGGTGPDGRPQGLHSNLPLAEVMRGADDPEGYLRSTLGALPKAIGSMGSVFDSDQYPHYLTYGTEIDNIGDVAKSALANALGNIPGVEQAESMYGLSQYPNKGLQGAISGQLGLSLGRIPTMEAAIQKDMEAERKKGHHPTRAQVIKYLEHHPGG